MATRTLNLTDELYDYLQSVSVREPDVLVRLREETAALEEARMQVGPEQGQFMALLVELLGASRALDVGTFTGYSSLAVALTLPPDGRLITCDVSEKWTNIARRYWEEAGVAHKIELRLGPALATLDALLAEGEEESFDFVFIDADKVNYDAYYERALLLLRPGGLIAIDNVLWDGKVADPGVDDAETAALRALNRKLHADARVSLSLVPIGDGLTLARRRG
ncbi:MAG: class I SAM-dependent methyltransferase [Gemmatimonadota bacterium]